MSDDVKPYKAVADLLNESERLQAALRVNASALAAALLKTIRHVPGYHLRDLKRTLRKYDSKRGEWK